jgi:carbonic anhydrase
VLACADSRVAPEWLFDVGPGELFDVRCAGNTAFTEGVASLEYAVAELGVPLVVVMGHQGCGAVTAALSNAPLTPALQVLVDPIRAILKPGISLDGAVKANALASAASLTRQSPLLAEAVAAGRLTIAAALFDLDSGLVQRL